MTLSNQARVRGRRYHGTRFGRDEHQKPNSLGERDLVGLGVNRGDAAEQAPSGHLGEVLPSLGAKESGKLRDVVHPELRLGLRDHPDVREDGDDVELATPRPVRWVLDLERGVDQRLFLGL
jgi:hypothetical protein